MQDIPGAGRSMNKKSWESKGRPHDWRDIIESHQWMYVVNKSPNSWGLFPYKWGGPSDQYLTKIGDDPPYFAPSDWNATNHGIQWSFLLRLLSSWSLVVYPIIYRGFILPSEVGKLSPDDLGATIHPSALWGWELQGSSSAFSMGQNVTGIFLAVEDKCEESGVWLCWCRRIVKFETLNKYMSRSQKWRQQRKLFTWHWTNTFCLVFVKKTNHTCTLSKQREILQLFHANQLHNNDSASILRLKLSCRAMFKHTKNANWAVIETLGWHEPWNADLFLEILILAYFKPYWDVHGS